jgi:hypothetical protein
MKVLPQNFKLYSDLLKAILNNHIQINRVVGRPPALLLHISENLEVTSTKIITMEVGALSLGGASMDRHVVTKVHTQESKESETTDDSSNSGGMSAHEIYGVEVVDIYPIEPKKENLPVMTMEPMNKSLSVKSKMKKKNKLSTLLFGKKVEKKDSKAPKATCLIRETAVESSSVVSVSAPRTKKKKKKATEAEHQPELPSSAPEIARPSEITPHESKDADAEDKVPTEEENPAAESTNDTNKESDDPIESNEGMSIEKPIEKEEAQDNKEVTIGDTDQIKLLDSEEAPDESIEATDVVGETRLAMISRGAESVVVVTKSILCKEEEPVSKSTKRSTRLAGFIKSGEKTMLTTPGEPKQSYVDTKANDPSNEPTESEQLKIGEVSGTNELATEVTTVASKGAAHVSNEDSVISQLIPVSDVQKKNFKTTHVHEIVSDSELNEQIVDTKVMNIEGETEDAEMNETEETDVSNYEEASEKSFDDSEIGEEYDVGQMEVLLKSDMLSEVGNIISSAPEDIQPEVSTTTAEEESDDLIEKESGPTPELEPTDSSSKNDRMSEIPDIQCTDIDSDTLVNIIIDTVLCGNNPCGTDADKGDNLDKALRVLFFDDDTCATYDDDLNTLGTLDDLDDVSIAAYILKRHATRLGITESELLKKINKEQGKKKFLPRKFDGTRKIPARIPSKIPATIPARRSSRSSLSGLFKVFKLNRACCHPQGMAEF